MVEIMADAPIPGENYLSDTRNYPWHRPPEIVDYDQAVDYLINRLTETEHSELIYSLIKTKQPLTGIVAGIMMQSIGRGKIAIDLAILAAGPIYRYLEILAEQNGIEYESGLEDKGRIPLTPTTLKAAVGILDDDEPEAEIETPNAIIDASQQGLMERPEKLEPSPADEQAMMLGLMDDEAEDANAV
jgi:hypothetical protein